MAKMKIKIRIRTTMTGGARPSSPARADTADAVMRGYPFEGACEADDGCAGGTGGAERLVRSDARDRPFADGAKAP